MFFFQAEDGIRDVAVTGVQTCALPISRRTRMRQWGREVSGLPWRSSPRTRATSAGRWRCGPWSRTSRSEERRVGKSVDLGGRRIIKKKKKIQTRCAPRENAEKRVTAGV